MRHATANVGQGCVLDARRALFHEEDRWLCIADIHYGSELNRTRGQSRRQPAWCMAATEARLLELLSHYRPETLVLLGDVMDGGGSWRETIKLIERLQAQVSSLVFIEGNHDRKQLKTACQSRAWFKLGRFIFHHGHRFEAVWSEVRFELEKPSEVIHLTGHEHPAVKMQVQPTAKPSLMPALLQQRLRGTAAAEHWILPAFSPWAGGNEYLSPHEPLAAWLCDDEGVMAMPGAFRERKVG